MVLPSSSGFPVRFYPGNSEEKTTTATTLSTDEKITRLKRSRAEDGFRPLQRRTVRQRRNPEWAKKSPWIISGRFDINGKSYLVEEIGRGTYHKVFGFTEEGKMEIGDSSLDLSKIVLKTLNSGNVGPNKIVSVVTDEEEGYVHLQASGVPVVERFADPITFKDTDNDKNGKFWIVERMGESITGKEWKNCNSIEELDSKSKKVLDFAKKWLTEMANQDKDTINDFRKRNTMMNSDGQIKIVDFGRPETDEDDVVLNIASYVRDWANGNRVIFDWLISGFQDDKKPSFS